MAKLIYFFGNGKAEGKGGMKSLLGGKGAALAEMTHAGIEVPPGFTITTDVCKAFYKNRRKAPSGLDAEMRTNLKKLERAVGKRLGDPQDPLLVSVRSGAMISMPGMMDTILNLGLNDSSVVGLSTKTNNERFSYDCYRRFIMMFADVVMDVDKKEFEKLLEERKRARGIESDLDLNSDDMKWLSNRFQVHYKERVGSPFPQNPLKQLALARDAVFSSWDTPRAVEYRRLNKISDDLGTACSVQAMVFGNLGQNSGTGVGFTRDPGTGEKKFYGEFLLNAQGEDVVAGVRTPEPIAALKKILPKSYAQLKQITTRLEKYYRDMQDFEFTIQEGRLFMLQTRVGKRTGRAAVRSAVDMVREKLISQEEAVARVLPDQIDQLLHPVFDLEKRRDFAIIAKGLNASPGAASGRAVFDPARAVEMTEKGERVVLVRAETSPDDIAGMAAARGVLTATGGMTSHAAVVGRQMGKPSVVGCSEIRVEEENSRFRTGTQVITEGEYISIDGTTGEVMLGDVPVSDSEIVQVVQGRLSPKASDIYPYFDKFMKWVDKARTLKVRANADTPKDANLAASLGAQGIGLCRTEHMFFAPDRLPLMQKMILAETEEERDKALQELLPLQREDFRGLFDALAGKPVTIRTLDPPLHEFLPRKEELMVEVERLKSGGGLDDVIAKKEKLLERVEDLHESNPMLGLRGCRLGISLPAITRMQAQAIMEAALDAGRAVPEIMIPLISDVAELRNQKKVVNEVAKEVFARRKKKVKYMVGTMIEIPRAALTAGEIAEEAEFFSFGTNDLTQTTFGISRDDSGKFLPLYVSEKILSNDPFVAIDRTGVGRLLRLAVEEGRNTRPGMKIGICGEHGGEPSSVEFCHASGLDYVSCSPYRLPIARLAAAQAAIAESLANAKKKKKKKKTKTKTVSRKKGRRKK